MSISHNENPFKHTEEAKDKIRNWHIGRKMSDEARKNMSLARKAYFARRNLSSS